MGVCYSGLIGYHETRANGTVMGGWALVRIHQTLVWRGPTASPLSSGIALPKKGLDHSSFTMSASSPVGKIHTQENRSTSPHIRIAGGEHVGRGRGHSWAKSWLPIVWIGWIRTRDFWTAGGFFFFFSSTVPKPPSPQGWHRWAVAHICLGGAIQERKMDPGRERG